MDTPTEKPDTQRIVRALLADARSERDKALAARRADKDRPAPSRRSRSSRNIQL